MKGESNMRWFAQISVMAEIPFLIAAAGCVLYWMPFNFIVLFFLYQAYKQWKKDGGFEAWDPKVIRQFFENSKAMGL